MLREFFAFALLLLLTSFSYGQTSSIDIAGTGTTEALVYAVVEEPELGNLLYDDLGFAIGYQSTSPGQDFFVVDAVTANGTSQLLAYYPGGPESFDFFDGCLFIPIGDDCRRFDGTGFRVMTEEEYEGAQDGDWEDGPLVEGDPSEEGKKWLWTTREAAEAWLEFVEDNGETAIITEVPTDRPITDYPVFPHPPEGDAVQVPLDELGPATQILETDE